MPSKSNLSRKMFRKISRLQTPVCATDFTVPRIVCRSFVRYITSKRLKGCQYTAVAFGLRCRAAGVRPSMGSVGDWYDNALCESFLATLGCELLDRHTFRTPQEARIAVFDFIEGWYNPRRRPSALDYDSPLVSLESVVGHPAGPTHATAIPTVLRTRAR